MIHRFDQRTGLPPRTRSPQRWFAPVWALLAAVVALAVSVLPASAIAQKPAQPVAMHSDLSFVLTIGGDGIEQTSRFSGTIDVNLDDPRGSMRMQITIPRDSLLGLLGLDGVIELVVADGMMYLRLPGEDWEVQPLDTPDAAEVEETLAALGLTGIAVQGQSTAEMLRSLEALGFVVEQRPDTEFSGVPVHHYYLDVDLARMLGLINLLDPTTPVTMMDDADLQELIAAFTMSMELWVGVSDQFPYRQNLSIRFADEELELGFQMTMNNTPLMERVPISAPAGVSR